MANKPPRNNKKRVRDRNSDIHADYSAVRFGAQQMASNSTIRVVSLCPWCITNLLWYIHMSRYIQAELYILLTTYIGHYTTINIHGVFFGGTMHEGQDRIIGILLEYTISTTTGPD